MPICGNENSNRVELVEKEEHTQKNTSTWTVIDNQIEEPTIHIWLNH